MLITSIIDTLVSGNSTEIKSLLLNLKYTVFFYNHKINTEISEKRILWYLGLLPDLLSE